MRNIIPVFCFIIIVGSGINAEAIVYDGVNFPNGAASFADTVIEYIQGSNLKDPYTNPRGSLGAPDFNGDPATWVSLGDSGSLTLQFTDNYLTASGSSDEDLWIFERGDEEGARVEISVNNVDWIAVGEVPGGTAGIDIDKFIGSGVILGVKYYFVKLFDLDLGLSTNRDPTKNIGYAGADIDAVGASTPVPEPATILLLGSGLGGLLLSRRKKSRI